MSYPENHRASQCDVCLRDVGRENLRKVPFLYLDRNDHVHLDAFPELPDMKDYKQYYVCEECSYDQWVK